MLSNTSNRASVSDWIVRWCAPFVQPCGTSDLTTVDAESDDVEVNITVDVEVAMCVQKVRIGAIQSALRHEFVPSIGTQMTVLFRQAAVASNDSSD